MEYSKEELIRLVTEQVMASLSQQQEDPAAQGKSRCLVLGNRPEAVPEYLKRSTVLLDAEDYTTHRNLLRYDHIVITSLNITELADIALGRGGCSTTSEVVCYALLQGIEVLMPECALTHRSYAGQGSTALYHLLESYVNTLQVFGVKLLRRKDPVQALKNAVPEQTPIKRCKLSETRLITEAAALDLVKEAQEVELPAGALITPSAMDIFKEHKTVIIRR